MSTLAQSDQIGFPFFEQRLRERRGQLHGEIRDTLQRADTERHDDIASEVHDEMDSALATLIIDTNHAEVSRDVQEIRMIDKALQKLTVGSYGYCEDCGRHIARARLEVNPSASRCIKCQEHRERSYISGPTPSL